ncbi:MAG: cyclic pyranopterin monophosphate synthase MoaC [Dehalococcoidia bacterium]
MIEIFTDGACSGNPGPGGWAAIVLDGNDRVELKGSAEATTSNRMELTAAIEGLAYVPENSDVKLHSDSEYLVKSMTGNWKRRANLDLWQRLDELSSRRRVQWMWVRGHAGHKENERADRLAVEMASRAGNSNSESKAPSHFDSSGQAHMVDVSEKEITEREATARGRVTMKSSTLEFIEQGQAAKGDVLSVAKTAGIMGAKRTPDLIPLCHPLHITDVSVDFELDRAGSAIDITATVRAGERTGVEMEALTAVAVSALTIYDMCKAVDRGIRIESVRLVEKSGGKSGTITLE